MTTHSTHSYTEAKFINTVALCVLHGGWDDKLTEYQNGWFEGYAKAWTEITGRSKYELIREVNRSIAGSGKAFEGKTSDRSVKDSGYAEFWLVCGLAISVFTILAVMFVAQLVGTIVGAYNV